MDFISLHKQSYLEGGVRRIVRTAPSMCSVYQLPFPSDRKTMRSAKEKKMREREPGMNVTVYSAAAVLKNPAEGEGKGVCASIHVH